MKNDLRSMLVLVICDFEFMGGGEITPLILVGYF
jgi:hypothetical protein